jgi:hypothetical protein
MDHCTSARTAPVSEMSRLRFPFEDDHAELLLKQTYLLADAGLGRYEC